MRNLAVALINHEVIKTTEVKAKQLRQFVERLVTIAKDGIKAADPAGVTLAKRRLAFSYLQDKEAVKRLFDTVAPRCLERPGGYTRLVKCGRRMGDGAPMAYIEFVDRPVIIPEIDEKSKGTSRRRRQVGATA
jgi:large subunit ribosomal protein L17